MPPLPSIWPESKAGESDVTVWELPSRFVQQTNEPGATVTDAGEYENPMIETAVSPG